MTTKAWRIGNVTAQSIFQSNTKTTRRTFLSASAATLTAGALTGTLSVARSAHAAGDETIKIALVGCGNRGTGACSQALNTKGPVKLVAMADAFRDRLDGCLKSLGNMAEVKDRIDVSEDRKFVGFDAYQKALDSGVDAVLLVTPPAFRPIHYAAAIAAGKHVFMEKPLCVDAPGYRSIVATNAEAKKKNLAVGVGFMRRHTARYIEGIKRICDGQLGKMHFVRMYFNMPSGFDDTRRPENMTEMEWQMRRWGYYLWLSGDHIVEQACHTIDIGNWALGGHPIKANGMGGRQVRTGRGNGDIWDHHTVEFVYENEIRNFFQARQILGTWSHVSENVHCDKGIATLGLGPYGIGLKAELGVTERRMDRENNPYQQEHDDLFAAIRQGTPYCEGDYGADSSMTAILGRMATYSGKVVTWDEAVKSDLSLLPEKFAFDADPPTKPNADGYYPIAMPGATKAL